MTQQQLPSSPIPIKFNVDPPELSSSTPSSPEESKSGSSHSRDSATVATETTDISSVISQPEPMTTSSPAKCHQEPPPPLNLSYRTPGHKIVIDNIDKTVHPRDQRIDAQSQSLHYVQGYAVKNRIEYSKFSNTPPPSSRSVYDLLPSTSDYQALKDNFAVLIARILVKHIPYFSQDFKGLVPNHITHQFSSEMAEESEIVSMQ